MNKDNKFAQIAGLVIGGVIILTLGSIFTMLCIWFVIQSYNLLF